MVSRAEAKYVRIAPSKVRLVTRPIKGMNAKKAEAILETLTQKGAYLLKKVLKSAIANAKNKGYDENKLFISKAVANPGPALKRFRAATFGRAGEILKRTSHILVELDTPEKIIEDAKIK